MYAVVYIGLVAVLAYHLRTRVLLLDGFPGVFRYLFSLGLTLFLVNWLNFLLYVAWGWGLVYLMTSWAAVVAPVLYFSIAPPARAGAPADPPLLTRAAALLGSKWNWWFLFVFFFVVVRFYSGLDSDENNFFWSTFNFDDTPFHLSVAHALLNSHRFPPMDLDMAPYPLKYHFLADFWLAHLERLGTRAVYTILGMNCLSATIMVGALWAVFRKWLKLPSKWIMLACLIFFFFNTALVNVIHYLWFKPDYFHPDAVFDGLLLFPYFNFESLLINMFSPQRGLLFSFPIGLLVLDAVFGCGNDLALTPAPARERIKTLQALVLVCLLPLSHIVIFAVLACCLVPRVWSHRFWLMPRYWAWLPALCLGILQLLYLGAYGPAVTPEYASWNVAPALPLQEFAAVPALFRRAVFWLFIDGDFLFWGTLFAAIAWRRRWRRVPAAEPSPLLGDFLRQWRWYFAVCGLVFLGVNCYRYSFDWGDSNKFVLFVNFGLTMVIVLGAATLTGRLGRAVSRVLGLFFLVLCVVPSGYRLGNSLLAERPESVLLFHSNDRAAARWLRTSTQPSDVVLTGAYGSIHFVSSLAGRPVLAGIYGDSNPYRQNGRGEEIRRVYEDGDLAALRRLNPRYVCVSRYERSRYRLHSCWQKYLKKPGAVVFQVGAPGDANTVTLFDARVLLDPPPPAPAPGRGRPSADRPAS